MQKPADSLLAAVRELSIAERTYLAAYLDILATQEPDEKPRRGRPRKKKEAADAQAKLA